jgi:branched-chain amino acid transport system substrate-binding protein
MRWSLPVSAVVVALTLLLAGCGSEDEPDDGVSGTRTLTVYSSFPLQGDSRQQSQDMVNAIKLALSDAGGRVGAFTIGYVSLDSATREEGGWTSEQVIANARQALEDRNAIAYLGELDSAASAISLPLLNEAGILQVSPSSTYVGLTRTGGARGEPERFYPSGVRTFGRVVPADHKQAAAQVGYMTELGVRRLHVVHDREIYGAALAEQIAELAAQEGIEIVADEAIDPDGDDYESLGERVEQSGADALFYGGATGDGTAQLFADVHRASPELRLFGPDGLAEGAFLRELDDSVQERVHLTSPLLDRRLYPPAAREFEATFRERFGRAPQPYALFAYEAMRSVLQAVADADRAGNERRAVIDAFFALRNRESVLGTYSIDDNGDTTLTDYGGHRVSGGRLRFDKLLDVQA